MVVAFSARFTIVGPHVNYREVTSSNESGYSMEHLRIYETDRNLNLFKKLSKGFTD